MTIHLPSDVENNIRAAVQAGRFASVDAAMTEAANLLLQRLRQSNAVPTGSDEATQEQKPIWEEVLELTADVPAGEWNKLPTDLAEQHDHYIYGTPKRPVS